MMEVLGLLFFNNWNEENLTFTSFVATSIENGVTVTQPQVTFNSNNPNYKLSKLYNFRNMIQSNVMVAKNAAKKYQLFTGIVNETQVINVKANYASFIEVTVFVQDVTVSQYLCPNIS